MEYFRSTCKEPIHHRRSAKEYPFPFSTFTPTNSFRTPNLQLEAFFRSQVNRYSEKKKTRKQKQTLECQLPSHDQAEP
jgi:hypothetical protein